MLIFRPSETDDRKDEQPFSEDGINSYLIEGVVLGPWRWWTRTKVDKRAQA